MSGSHSSSDDSNDSRKRPPEELLFSDSIPKRPNCEDNVHLKLLIPSIAAGAVIGKSGEAIIEIQKKTNTRVKISKQDQFYPGTTERVCLIIGSTKGVQSVHNYIMGRIMENPDPNPHATEDGRVNVERHKQVKILVPNSTAGMIIGKCGSHIEGIKLKTGAYVQISQKPSDYNLTERCIVVAGNPDQTRAAVTSILTVIASDPQSSSCPNLYYDDLQGPVASTYPTGSPYAIPVTQSGVGTNTALPLSQQADYAATVVALFYREIQQQASQLNSNALNILNQYDASSLIALASATQGSSNMNAAQLNPSTSHATAFPSFIANSAVLSGTDLLTAGVAPFGAGPSQLSPTLVNPNMAAMQQQAALLTALRSSSSSSLATPRLSNQLLYQHQQQFSDSSNLGSPDSSSFPSIWPHSILAQGAVTGVSSGCSTPSITQSGALPALSKSAPIASCGSINPISHLQTSPSTVFGSLTPTRVPSLNMPLFTPVVTGHVGTSGIDNVQFTTGATTDPPHSWLLGLSEAAAALGTQTLTSADSSPLNLYAAYQSADQIAPVTFKRTISVPENLIGIILGPQGRSIVELQNASGTAIQISQKGVYLPGTLNRVVTITGPQPNVQWICDVIERRVTFEQFRRVLSSFPPVHLIPSLTDQSQSNALQLATTQAPWYTYPSFGVPTAGTSPSCTRFPTIPNSIVSGTAASPVTSVVQFNIQRVSSAQAGRAQSSSVYSPDVSGVEPGNVSITNTPVAFESSSETAITTTVSASSEYSRLV